MSAAEPQFVRFGDVGAFDLAPGVSGRPLFGEGAMLNLIRFEPGAAVPLHSHEHEQLGLVLEGMQALVVDGIAHELGPLEGYVLPGGVEHAAYCVWGAQGQLCGEAVLVDESSEAIATFDAGLRCCARQAELRCVRLWRCEVQRAVWPMAVVVLDKDSEHALEVALVDDQ
jgi:Cupin domain